MVLSQQNLNICGIGLSGQRAGSKNTDIRDWEDVNPCYSVVKYLVKLLPVIT